MGAVEPFTVVEGPYAWRASDYQDQSKYIYVFSESDIAELDSAIAAVQGRGFDNKVSGSYICDHLMHFLASGMYVRE